MTGKVLERRTTPLRVLRSFLGAVKVSINDIEYGLTISPETGTADSGDLEADLPELMLALGDAAKAAKKPIAIFIDELQYLSEGGVQRPYNVDTSSQSIIVAGDNGWRWATTNTWISRIVKILR